MCFTEGGQDDAEGKFSATIPLKLYHVFSLNVHPTSCDYTLIQHDDMLCFPLTGSIGRYEGHQGAPPTCCMRRC